MATSKNAKYLIKQKLKPGEVVGGQSGRQFVTSSNRLAQMDRDPGGPGYGAVSSRETTTPTGKK